MSDSLKTLIEMARLIEMSPEEMEAQRISFAFGNAGFENETITRDDVARASASLKDSGYEPSQPSQSAPTQGR